MTEEKKSLADSYFSAQKELWIIEDVLAEEIEKLFGPDEDQLFKDYKCHYRTTIEFQGCQKDFDLKGDQLDYIWKLGFNRVLISYKDKVPRKQYIRTNNGK